MAVAITPESFTDAMKSKELVESWLNNIKDNINEEVAAACEEVWQKIKDAACDLCPVDTGSLRSSIALGSEGGSGTIQASEANEFYSDTISAGDPSIVNPKSGKGTDEYAIYIHDGHMMRDGTFYEGEPFLEDALMLYEDELIEAVNRALNDLFGD
jgi:hypothetical protein